MVSVIKLDGNRVQINNTSFDISRVKIVYNQDQQGIELYSMVGDDDLSIDDGLQAITNPIVTPFAEVNGGYDSFSDMQIDFNNLFAGLANNKQQIITITDDTTLDNTFQRVNCDASLKNINIALPPSANCFINGTGLVVYFKKIDSSNFAINIIPDGSEIIDGQSTLVLDLQYQSATIYTDGINWFIQ